MRNSNHGGLRHVREVALDDSDSSESVREDSNSDEETGLRPLRESFLPHPSLCYISLTVSSRRRMKRTTTRIITFPRVFPKPLNNFLPLSPLLRHPFYLSIVPSIVLLAYLTTEIISTCYLPLVYSNGSNFGAGCTTGTLISSVTGFRLNSSRPLANAPFFYRCCATGKPV